MLTINCVVTILLYSMLLLSTMVVVATNGYNISQCHVCGVCLSLLCWLGDNTDYCSIGFNIYIYIFIILNKNVKKIQCKFILILS